jgi:hypothetical protein
MASGLSMPVGFKNGTDGNLGTAINALQAASSPHAFMGINQQGQVALLQTQGNPDGHVILRGGKHPNYDSVNVSLAEEALEKAGLLPGLVVDCSHGNSSKDHRLQPKVADNVIHQIQEGNLLHHRGDARIQPVRRQPVQRAAQVRDALRRLHHRCLHRLGDHGCAAGPPPQPAGGTTFGQNIGISRGILL